MSLSKTVLLLARDLHTGGSERQLVEIAKALHTNGWTVHVGCFRDTGIRIGEVKEAGIPLVLFPVSSFFSASCLNGIATFHRYIRRHNIALIHSFDTPLNIFATFAAQLMSQGPVILTSQRSYRSLFSRTEQRQLRVTDRLADGVVVNCDAIRRHMITDHGLAEERVHLCYNGLDSDTFFPAPRPRPAHLADARAVIVSVGVLRPEKDLPTLVRAFAAAHRERPGIRLVIVGNGPLRDPLEQLAQSLGVQESVEFLPATLEVAQWLNTADVFVLPSLSEALSNSLMEAMACGIAPIASNVGGNPELIREGETGLLFPPGDAEALAAQICRLIDDEPLRRRMASAAASFIQSEMSMAKAGARMAEIYSGVLSRR